MKTLDVFELNDKRRLYWLMDLYLSDRINVKTFCDEYYYTYDLGEINDASFDQKEEKIFAELSAIVDWTCLSQEAHGQHPGVYYTVAQLKQKVIEVKEALASQYEKAMTEAFIITSINAD